MERSNTHPHDEEDEEHKCEYCGNKGWQLQSGAIQFGCECGPNLGEEDEEEEECTDENKCGECTHCARTKVCEYCGCVGGCDEECNADIVVKCYCITRGGRQRCENDFNCNICGVCLYWKGYEEGTTNCGCNHN